METKDYSKIPLTMEALEDGAVSLVSSKASKSYPRASELKLEYSINNSEWVGWDLTTPIKLNKGDKLQLQGDNSCISTHFTGETHKLNTEMPVNMSGNVVSLLSKDNYSEVNLSRYTFYELFTLTKAIDCSNLVIDCNSLGYRSCSAMFLECRTLKKAPKLPIMKLSEGCYSEMFYNCVNLTEAPELPAIHLKEDCYSHMFANCLRLVTGPSIKAEILDKQCFSYMFQGCESLKSLKEFTSMNHFNERFGSMFCMCNSLEYAYIDEGDDVLESVSWEMD